MHTLQRPSLLFLVLVLAVTACQMPTITIVDPIVQATSQALTVMAIVNDTQQAASVPPTAFRSPTASQTPAPPSPTVTPSETPTPTQTPTAIVIFTVTPFVPIISVSLPTNCREGPGKAYPIAGALLVGETAQIYAGEPTGKYWYIPNPDDPGDFCWVWGEYATITGITVSLPVFTPMPTPTATMTPTPAPTFDISYDGLVACVDKWWPEIGLENTGSITFRSVEITVRDTVADTEKSDASDGFIDRTGCDSSTSKSSLLPGKSATISSPKLSDDPSGHKLRVTVTLCSETGQDGTCTTKSITFKP